ncbi:VWA domain-containing protein [Rhodocyclaceae bacterium SMB388]
MSLVWPAMLWGLLLLPALVACYLLLQRRRKRNRLRYPSLALIRGSVGPGQSLRCHVPPALLLLALAATVFALARPSSIVILPSDQRTLILALDVSLSMSAPDIEPNRLAAAQAAARGFVEDLPSDLQVGIVSFAGTASLVQAPTIDRMAVVSAIDRLLLDRHTAIGSAILVSLATLFPAQGPDLDTMLLGDWQGASSGGGRAGEASAIAVPGSYPSAAIILLTDGRSTTGPHPIEAARVAADRGVRVYTVGFGTTEGATVTTEGWSMYMRFDEGSLRAVADITDAEYFHAGTAADLRRVYDDLSARFVLERQETELTALFAAAATALAVLAGLLSLVWFNREI